MDCFIVIDEHGFCTHRYERIVCMYVLIDSVAVLEKVVVSEISQRKINKHNL